MNYSFKTDVPVEYRRRIPTGAPNDRRTFADVCPARRVAIGLLDHLICGADAVRRKRMDSRLLLSVRNVLLGECEIRVAAKRMFDPMNLLLNLQHRDLDGT